MNTWNMATVAEVRQLRSLVTIAIYDLSVSAVPEGEYVDKLRLRAFQNLNRACKASSGVTVELGDMKFWEEPRFDVDPLTDEQVRYKAIGARWFPTTGTIELVGGPRDGELYTLQSGAVGQPFYVLSPDMDPMWDSMAAGDTIPTVAIRKLAYVPAGWNPGKRIWLYSPERY